MIQEQQVLGIRENVPHSVAKSGPDVSLHDLSLFQLVNEVMKEIFVEPYPARAALQVARLPMDSSIEVEAIVAKTI